LKGSWGTADITYGKFCVDSYNNLYILDIDGNCIVKKSNRGELLLRSDEIVEIEDSYAINIGPNGYVYFTQDIGDTEIPEYCIKKINPNTLVVEDIMNLTNNKIYYGFAIDSEIISGEEIIYIYIYNYSDNSIEKWAFEDGNVILKTLNFIYDNNELAIAGDYIGGVGEVESVEKAFKILKDLSTIESKFPLINIPEPLYISSIGGDFLFSGLDDNSQIVFEKYRTDDSLEWNQPIVKINNYPYLDCIIGAYPF